MIAAVVAAFGGVSVYFDTVEEGNGAIAEDTAWALVGVGGAAWAFIFCSFLGVMKRDYWATFISLQTGNLWAQSYFLGAGKTDEQRVRIVTFNSHLWASIRGDVREWFNENWDKWEEEQPEWFNDVFVAKVDDDLLPKGVLEELKEMGGGERERDTASRDTGASARYAGSLSQLKSAEDNVEFRCDSARVPGTRYSHSARVLRAISSSAVIAPEVT